MNPRTHQPFPCGRVGRRTFLADLGMGCAGLALGNLLQSESRGATDIRRPHHAPRATNVIWVFLSGGVSHLETFDPKPKLNELAGKTYDESTLPNPQKSPLFLERSRSVVGMDREVISKIFPLQIGFSKRGESGIEVSDWHPRLAQVVDDLCVVRSMWTTDNDHAAEFQMHTGRHALDEQQPTIGSWVSYGLGSLNENLPQFVFLGQYKDTRVKKDFAADYLGPQHAGIELSLDPANPSPSGLAPRASRSSSRNGNLPSSTASTGSRPSSIPTTRSCGRGFIPMSWPTACRCRLRRS